MADDDDQVGVREFRKNLSHWIDEARSGRAVVITRNGEIAVRLAPIPEGADDGDG